MVIKEEEYGREKMKGGRKSETEERGKSQKDGGIKRRFDGEIRKKEWRRTNENEGNGKGGRN